MRGGSRLLCLCAVIVGCAGTRLTVQVDSPAGAPRSDVYVHLLQPEALCALGGAARTDENGRAHLSREYCGPLQLVVAAPGYETARRQLDTCDHGFVHVALQKAPPPGTPPEDPCARAARAFVEDWLAGDHDAVRAHLVSPELAPSLAREPGAPSPWRLSFDASRIDGAQCAVPVRLFYDPGCIEAFRIDLLQVGGVFRVRGLVRRGYER